MIGLLGYIPFVTPLGGAFHDWWYLSLIPLCFGISVIYKALRMRRLDRFWHHALTMTMQIVGGMVLLALALVLLVQVLIPRVPMS